MYSVLYHYFKKIVCIVRFSIESDEGFKVSVFKVRGLYVF